MILKIKYELEYWLRFISSLMLGFSNGILVPYSIVIFFIDTSEYSTVDIIGSRVTAIIFTLCSIFGFIYLSLFINKVKRLFVLSSGDIVKNKLLNKTCDNCCFGYDVFGLKATCKLFDKYFIKSLEQETCNCFEEIKYYEY